MGDGRKANLNTLDDDLKVDQNHPESVYNPDEFNQGEPTWLSNGTNAQEGDLIDIKNLETIIFVVVHYCHFNDIQILCITSSISTEVALPSVHPNATQWHPMRPAYMTVPKVKWAALCSPNCWFAGFFFFFIMGNGLGKCLFSLWIH